MQQASSRGDWLSHRAFGAFLPCCSISFLPSFHSILVLRRVGEVNGYTWEVMYPCQGYTLYPCLWYTLCPLVFSKKEVQGGTSDTVVPDSLLSQWTYVTEDDGRQDDMRASLTVETTAVTFADRHASATRATTDVAHMSWSSSRTSQLDADDDAEEEDDDDDEDDETEEEEVGSVVEEGDVGREDFRVKPMSRLPVCPADDLVLEEEKRRRRSMRMLRAKQHRRNCADAESLPSPARRGLPASGARSPVPTAPRPPLSTPQLRRDSMAIRQQYMKQLGLNMSRRDLERSTGRITQRREGLKVALNDSRSHRGESKTIFQMIKSWYGTNTATRSNSADEATILASDTASETTSTSGSSESSSPRRKAVRFVEDAELFYIPLHCDYSKRQRDCMWHTRAEFIAMVERNLDDVYEEMEREYEEQVEMEMAENDAMAQEEARQREYEAHLRAQAQKAAEAKAAAATVAASTTSPVRVTADTAASPPNLELCPIATQIKVTPRARTSHALRFKYLKHLGIDS